MPAAADKRPRALHRGRTFDLGQAPADLFVASDDIKVGVWDPFIPKWGTVVKHGVTSVFDEVTYGQMLDDLAARDLCVYMDQDHRTASACWSMEHTDIPALAYYCAVAVTHGGKLWRSIDLHGHTCAAAAPLDPAVQPEGMHGYRCRITPKGRQELPNYQALSIHFDPFGEDLDGHPVGQVLICVSAVNGPQVPGAGPGGGQFSNNTRYFDMKKKHYVFAAEDAGDGEAETKNLSVEMAELASCLGMPEGSAPEAIIGAALAVLKSQGAHAEPDGDEQPLEGDKDGEQMPADAMKYMGDAPDSLKGYARRAALRFSRPARLVGILSKELGCKGTAKETLKAFLAFKAKSVDGGEFAQLKGRLESLEKERETEKATERTKQIEAIFSQHGPEGAGLLSSKKIEELRAQAAKYNASPEDVLTWMPSAEGAQFTAGGTPKGKAPSGGGDGGDGEGVRGADQAKAIGDFRNQYQKESGKRLKHDMAAQVCSQFFRSGKQVDYAQAKAAADRLPETAFLKGGK